MKSSHKDYDKLHSLSKHAAVLKGIFHILEWDQETYMPAGASMIRAEQVKTISGIIHKERTGKKFQAALSKLIEIDSGKIIAKGLSARQKAAVKLWRKDFLQEIALPTSFVEEFSQLTSQATVVWRSARQNNAFHHFVPFLDRIVAMCRRKAELLGYKKHPYNAQLDQFEPDTTVDQLNAIFDPLKKSIATLLKKIKAAKPIDNSFLQGNFSHDKQMHLSKIFLDAMHYDFNKGRLDISTHPFSSASHPTDSRITSRITPTSFTTNLFAVLHECGHALYEMGLPVEEYGSPLGEHLSMGMHESQSRWWETRIGQSKPFWQHYLHIVKREFAGQFDKVDLDTFYRAINKVEPSLIRIESDEVTYSLHVILRYEIEKGLIEGSFNVRDIPEIWNAKMKELLGVVPKNNAEGCLQDIHWSLGTFGYFPSYTLGNLYAAHLFEAFEKAFPQWQEKVSHGDLEFIKEWLNTNIHQYGRQFSTLELLKKITGKPFSSEAFMTYLNKKYGEIYSK